MSVWDFIREAYLGTGAMLSANWPLVLVFALILIVFGWLWTIARSETMDDEPRPFLSQRDIKMLNAWNGHGTLPPSLFPEWYRAEDEAEMIVENVQSAYVEQDERFDNPS